MDYSLFGDSHSEVLGPFLQDLLLPLEVEFEWPADNWPRGKTAADYIMHQEDVANVALLMASLPPEVNLFNATILPNHMKSFIDRG